jgi:hypothetical protein
MTSQIRKWYGSLSPLVVVTISITTVAAVAAIIMVLSGVGDIPAAILVGSIPVAVPLIGQLISNDQQHRREIDLRLRESKKDAYDVFVGWWIKVMTDQPYQKRMLDDPKLLTKDMAEVSQPLMLWASNDVVRAITDWKIQQGMDREEVVEIRNLSNLRKFEQILFRMREDMGHERENLPDFYVLALLINDAHKYVGKPDDRPR